MHRVDFNDFPRPTRERFVRSLVSESPVARPICRRVASTRSGAGWLFLLVSGAAAVAVLAALRFGFTDTPVQDRRYLVGYVLAYAAVALGGSMLARRRAIKGSLPFAPGVYVFPVDLVDARTRSLVLYPLSTLQSFDVVHHEANGKYTRTTLRFAFPTASFAFEYRDKARADAEAAAVEQARANVNAALANGGTLARLAAVDPFAEARARRFVPARDHGLLARGRPSWIAHIWVITLLVSVTCGVASFFVRNASSDERAFARIASSLDLDAAERYLRGGGRRAFEVENVVVPRALLTLAMKRPTAGERAEAIARMLERHPKSGIDREARAALADAHHQIFLSQRETVGGLQSFASRYPDAADAEAARSMLDEHYQSGIGEFLKHADTSDKNLMAVLPPLVGYAKTTGQPIDVRIRPHIASSITDAEKDIAKARGPGGSRGPEIVRAVAPDAALQLALVAALERTLRNVFQSDIVALRLGPPLEGPAPIPGTPPLASPAAPVIVLDYEVGWDHAVYESADPHARFVGIAFAFDLTVQLPNEPRVLHFATKADPPRTLPFEYKIGAPSLRAPFAAALPKDGALDARVYTSMLVRALDLLASRWATVFAKSTASASHPTAVGAP